MVNTNYSNCVSSIYFNFMVTLSHRAFQALVLRRGLPFPPDGTLVPCNLPKTTEVTEHINLLATATYFPLWDSVRTHPLSPRYSNPLSYTTTKQSKPSSNTDEEMCSEYIVEKRQIDLKCAHIYASCGELYENLSYQQPGSTSITVGPNKYA